MSKILWCGDAIASTGFSKCTHAACDYLHKSGHEIIVLGINSYGDDHPYPYPIYSCFHKLDGGNDLTGQGRLPRMIMRHRPDVVVILQDPWNIKSYFTEIDKYLDALDKAGQYPADFKMPVMIGWLAVDGKNQQSASDLNRLDHVVTWVQFGLDELRKGGYTGPGSIIPCGVDASIYKPMDKSECRSKYVPGDVPPNAFIVGTVGRIQHRKRFDLTIQYFSEWVHETNNQDAWLYLHACPTGDDCCDLIGLARYWGLSGRVILSNPRIGSGWDEDELAQLYNCFDVLAVTSQGEGWHLPSIEAMACGVPVICGDWAALGEWAKNSAYLVPCTSTALNNGLPKMHAIGGIPDREKFIDGLVRLYQSKINLKNQSWDYFHGAGLKCADSFPWSRVGEMWAELVNDLKTEKVITMENPLYELTPETAREVAREVIEMAKEMEERGDIEFDQESVDCSIEYLGNPRN